MFYTLLAVLALVCPFKLSLYQPSLSLPSLTYTYLCRDYKFRQKLVDLAEAVQAVSTKDDSDLFMTVEFYKPVEQDPTKKNDPTKRSELRFPYDQGWSSPPHSGVTLINFLRNEVYQTATLERMEAADELGLPNREECEYWISLKNKVIEHLEGLKPILFDFQQKQADALIQQIKTNHELWDHILVVRKGMYYISVRRRCLTKIKKGLDEIPGITIHDCLIPVSALEKIINND